MTLKRTLAKNFTALLLSKVAGRLLTLVISIVIARYLGKSDFGIYSAAQSFVGLFVIFFSLGLESGFVYKGSKDKRVIPWFLSTGIVLQAILWCFVFAIMIVAAKLLGYSLTYQYMIIIVAGTWLFISFQSFFSSVFQIHQRMEYNAVLDIGRELAFLIILALVVLFNLGIYATAGAKLIANVLFLVVAVMLLLKFTKLDFSEIRMRDVIKHSYLFAFGGFFYVIYSQVDTVMLSLMRTPAETGIYAAAYKIPMAAFMVSGIVSIATRPTMFAGDAGDRTVLRKIYFLRSKYLVIIGLFLTLSVWLLRDQIIALTFGHEFTQSSVVLVVLAWLIPMRFIANVSGDVITSVGKQNVRTILQGITAVLNFGINFILIPRYGVFGAAWARFACELFLCISYYVAASWLFRSLPFADTFVKPLLASCGMAVLFLTAQWNWFASFVVGCIAFWLILIVTGAFRNDPLVIAAKRLLPKFGIK